MTWFKVDDSFASHPKVMAIPRKDRVPAIGLWCLAGAWCAQQLTDGRLGQHMIAEFGSTKRVADLLVHVGLWLRIEDGYEFHDWAAWQPSRAQVHERRDAEAKRKAEWRDKKRAKTSPDASVPAGQPRDTNVTRRGRDATVRSTRPDPTRPDPKDNPPGGGDAAAQSLIAEWIEHCGERPPGRVVGQVAKELKAMLTEGIPESDVRTGLAAWHGKGLHPSALASVVHETRTSGQRTTTRTSTTDQRVQAAFDLAAKFEAKEQGQLAIEGKAS